VTHGKRVVKLLGVDDLFDGITWCDYSEPDVVAKPQPRMYEKAMKEAGIENVADCYFVGKSIMILAQTGYI
jgi:pyrimidine and pyridine-specific 5'-nucleotidase